MAQSLANRFAQRAGHIWFCSEDLADTVWTDIASNVTAFRRRTFPASRPKPLPTPSVAETIVLPQDLAVKFTGEVPGEINPNTSEQARVRFAQLKRLVGQWKGQAPHDAGPHEGTITYKLTSAGSTLMETMFAGSEHEMVTMYHLDGEAIVLTHYCALGNQPRMKYTPTDDSKKLVFHFLDGTNLDPAKDMHMHEATIEFVADDHIRSTWTLYTAGKPDHTTAFDLKRKN